MGHHHHPVEIDPQDIERANKIWQGFTEAGKWTVIAVVVVLVLLAAAFVRWS